MNLEPIFHPIPEVPYRTVLYQIEKIYRDTVENIILQCCGSGIFIPDPNFSHPGSLIRIKEFKYFNPKIVSKISEIILDPGCTSLFSYGTILTLTSVPNSSTSPRWKVFTIPP
jgi:hypothetical protein